MSFKPFYDKSVDHFRMTIEIILTDKPPPHDRDTLISIDGDVIPNRTDSPQARGVLALGCNHGQLKCGVGLYPIREVYYE
jgi:hypothetical protein